MVTHNLKQTPQKQENPINTFTKPITPSQNNTHLSQNHTNLSQNHNNNNTNMFSPRFKSVAAMAGWDEEALMMASLVVEDTPERNLRNKKRSGLSFISPPTSSKRKRRRARPSSIPIAVLNLDDDDEDDKCRNTNNKEVEKDESDLPKKVEESPKEKEQEKSDNCSSSSTIACMDRLRDELSCAICLDICYEPSTTPCGHSFCKSCLKSAADKCGKRCPKCRQLISNGRSCTINTVLWNTIQLLFPGEVESRKAALNSRAAEMHKKSPENRVSTSNNNQADDNRNLHLSRRIRSSRRLEEASLSTRRRGVPNQDEDAALALRLQREEFMQIYRVSGSARENLRAMARRAMNVPRNRAV